MPPLNIYPSFQSLYVADELFVEVSREIAGFRGRIGVAWFWKIGRDVIAEFELRYSRTEARWDTIVGQATSAAAGPFAEIVLPLMAYSTEETSHAYIHEANGIAHWANRRLLVREALIGDMVEWLMMLGGKPPKSAMVIENLKPKAANESPKTKGTKSKGRGKRAQVGGNYVRRLWESPAASTERDVSGDDFSNGIRSLEPPLPGI